MSRPATETNIEEIARALTAGRDQGQRTVLFLGSRAGGLFGNKYLYETLKKFSLLNFDNLSNEDKFKACYRVLSRHFSEREIHDILLGALGSLKYREEDKLLMDLVKAGFFEVIISTNIDALLEDACSFLGMQEPNDYRVFIPGIDDTAEIEHNKPRCAYIIKVFGDLDSLQYNIAGSEFDLQADPRLKKLLESKLTRNVLIVGYDSIWDHLIERAFLPTGGTIWYVNEEALLQNTYLAHVLEGRGSKCLEGDQGSYAGFWRVLYDLIGKGASRERETAPFYPLSRLQSSVRKNVFISYSHKDKRYLEELLPHLSSFERAGKIDCWSDKKIEVGMDWQEQIMQALEAAEAAILLISKYFLSSGFIADIELPRLLGAARNKGLIIIPVILGKCVIHDTSLHQFQAINSPEKPLNRMRSSQRDDIWVEIAERLGDA